ncbi:MAG: alkaline phosphatase PhoX [Bradymonadia bacterium]
MQTPLFVPGALRRRDVLRLAGLTALQLSALGCRTAPQPAAPSVADGLAAAQTRTAGFGPLVSRPGGLVDLPEGFKAIVVQRAGTDRLDDGRLVPGCFDGMTCFDVGGGRWVLLRNHELGNGAWLEKYGYVGQEKIVPWTAADLPVDPTMHGGVSRLTVDGAAVLAALGGDAAARPVLSTRMALTGTDCNCAGGRWSDGWISCEETEDVPGHGYAFHVPAAEGAPSRRLDTWGRFKREAVVLAPDGAIYMTEDIKTGCFYRFRPTNGADPFGPGVVEVLSVPGLRDTDKLPAGYPLLKGETLEVQWLPVPDPQAVTQPCRDQVPVATRFNRSEGLVWDGQALWLSATQGGQLGKGQLWRLTPGAGGGLNRLSLPLEVTDSKVLSLPDNLAMAPWGDLLLCEDNYSSDANVTHQHLRGLTPGGALYDLARNPLNTPKTPGGAPGDEFAGACFSPDGRVLFVNLQGSRDETLAITGPWPARS